MKIIVIDNYDSFTYNLVHLIKEVGASVSVVRNDQFALADIEPYDKIVLSPGPGIPSEAGLLLDVIKAYAGKKPILGVCLGHQAIGEAFGATLENLSEVFHGVQTAIVPTKASPYNNVIFNSLPLSANDGEGLLVGRYHSWVVSKKNFSACLTITAESPEGQIMAIQHNEYPVYGIQFHPESVLTPNGKQMIKNFLLL